MNRYRTLQKIELFTGILELDEKQAKGRAHCLQDLGEGLFEITSPVQFKIGEEFGYDGEVTKTMLTILEPISAAVPAKK